MGDDYKYKTDKHKFRIKNKTIDEIHQEFIEEFKNSDEKLLNLDKELKASENELLILNQKKTSNLDMITMKKKNDLKTTIITLTNNIEAIKNKKNEIDYFCKGGDIIYDYYDLTNGILYGQQTEKEDIINNSQFEISKELLELIKYNKKKKIKKEKRKRKKENEEDVNNKSIMSFFSNNATTPEENNGEKNSKICKTSIQNEYLSIFNIEYSCNENKLNLIKDCLKCNIKMLLLYNDSKLVCPNCGITEEIIIEIDVPLHKESFNEKPKYPYKRIGHCIEKLNQLLCKKSVYIQPEVFNKIYLEIKKHCIEKKDITEDFIHKVLKKNKWTILYDDIRYIHSKITGKTPETITREEYEEVLKRFSTADEIYEKKYKPKDRNNFLKYTYVLNKIFLSINRPDVAKYFKLFKSPIRTKNHDKVWKYICDDTGWKYFSS